MNAQRGSSLVEVLFVVAILSMISALAFTSGGFRLFETRSSAMLFDTLLAHSKALASSAGGVATLSFAPAPNGSGTVVTVSPPDVPPETLRADVSEPALGKPPFAISVDSYGHALSPQPCPSGGYSLTFTAGPASEERLLPCALDVSGPPEPRKTMPP